MQAPVHVSLILRDPPIPAAENTRRILNHFGILSNSEDVPEEGSIRRKATFCNDLHVEILPPRRVNVDGKSWVLGCDYLRVSTSTVLVTRKISDWWHSCQISTFLLILLIRHPSLRPTSILRLHEALSPCCAYTAKVVSVSEWRCSVLSCEAVP